MQQSNIVHISNTVTHAICQFYNIQNKYSVYHGYALIADLGNQTIIKLNLHNLPPGLHGFHVHELADMRNGCKSLGPHYNPFNKKHGGLTKNNRHIGDLGNIIVDEYGKCKQMIKVDYLPLNGPYSILGRSMIIHDKPDDLGFGDNEESHTTGNSGVRIACGIIGRV